MLRQTVPFSASDTSSLFGLWETSSTASPIPPSLHPSRGRYAPPPDEVPRVSHDRFHAIADLSKVGRLDQRMLARTNVRSQGKETWRGQLERGF
jgi:hypothetical protein